MAQVLSTLADEIQGLAIVRPTSVSGRVSRFDGHIIECDGFPATIGTLCEIDTQDRSTVNAEVIGFQNNQNLLSVHDHDAQISVGARVVVTDDGHSIKVGPGLLGRAIDALGHPLDDGPPLQLNHSWPLNGKKTNPLARRPVDKQLDVGVRVINSLLTVGQGQRIGIIATIDGVTVVADHVDRIIAITRIDCACGCIVGESIAASRQCDDFNTAECIGVTCQVNCNARTCIE